MILIVPNDLWIVHSFQLVRVLEGGIGVGIVRVRLGLRLLAYRAIGVCLRSRWVEVWGLWPLPAVSDVFRERLTMRT